MTARPLPCDFLPLTWARRARIERTIELLLAALDELDGDPDLEPVLGWCENHGRGVRSSEPTDDREGDDERDCDLAGAVSDVEGDLAHYDEPGFIWGGNESGGPAHSDA